VLAEMSILSLGHNQFPIQWATTLSVGGKAGGAWS